MEEEAVGGERGDQACASISIAAPQGKLQTDTPCLAEVSDELIEDGDTLDVSFLRFAMAARAFIFRS